MGDNKLLSKVIKKVIYDFWGWEERRVGCLLKRDNVIWGFWMIGNVFILWEWIVDSS